MDDFEQGYESDVEYDDAPAQSSIAAPLIRALLAAAVAFGVYWLVFSDMGGDDLELDAADQPTVDATAPSPAATAPVPLDPMPTAPATDAATATETPGGQVGAGVTAQVIAGSGTTSEQFAAAVSALREMGYDVTESGISPNAYPQTTIFATAGEEAQAQALMAADPRFTVVGENPGTLTDQIQIHILVGEDWPIGTAATPTEG